MAALDTPQPVRFVNVSQILVKAASTEQIPQAIDEITDLLRERHRIRSGQLDDFNIRDMTEITNTMAAQSAVMTVLLLVVAGISLVVGGVGIMNIMLVSVTERTREIGLRMAVGARSHHILRQFLVEAVVLCLVGGAIGIAFGRGLSMLVRYHQALPHRGLAPGHRRGRGGLGHGRHRLRLLSRLEGLAAGPDRSPAVRIGLVVRPFRLHGMLWSKDAGENQ